MAVIWCLFINCSSNRAEDNFLDCREICQFGSKYVEWFHSSNLDSMIAYIQNTDYKLSELTEFRESVKSQLGNRIGLLNVQYGIEPWQYYYIQYNHFKKVDQPVRTLFTFSKKGMILQFSVQVLQQEAKTRFSDYITKTKLSLPFKEKWFVAWGGRSINENQHAISKSQRFAFDFVIRKRCKTFEGNGKLNDNYHCYEKEIIAPGEGTVVDILDGVEENQVGQVPETHGNRVIIDHNNGEFSVLSHFKNGSIAVKLNDHVERGQFLGLCGNTGASSEPHIHYHLQNSPDINNAEGLPIKFDSFLLNGKYAEFFEPKIGEYVQNHTRQ